jgi:hypothetical protein
MLVTAYDPFTMIKILKSVTALENFLLMPGFDFERRSLRFKVRVFASVFFPGMPVP